MSAPGTLSREDATRKAAALLRLAAKAGTPAEAANAAAHAQAMMDRYELSRSAVEYAEHAATAEPDEPFMEFGSKPGGELDGKPRMDEWRRRLAAMLARLNGCFLYTSTRAGNRTLELVGRPGQVEKVRYLYGWLAGEVRRLTDEHGRGMGVVWRREFAEGATQEIGEILKAKRAEIVHQARADAGHNPLAIMRVNTAIAKLEDTRMARDYAYSVLRLQSGKRASSRSYDGGAREAGAKAARSLNLSRSAAALPGARARMLPER